MRPAASSRREAGLLAGFLLLIGSLITLLSWPNQQQQQESGTLNFAVLAFNLDTQSPVIQQGEPNTFFGYSVAQHRDRNTNWLLVGAPKAQTLQPNTREAGAVYKCSPLVARDCGQIPFDLNGSSLIQLGQEQRQSDEKAHQWFGSSLNSAKENGIIVACAPRYVYFSGNLRRRDPVGACWTSRGSFQGFFEYSPCRRNDMWGHHHLGSCQAGFSSAISKDGSRLFMGAPGARVWQGQTFMHNLRTDLQNSTSAENPHSEDDSYLGYALALGKFSSASSAAAGSQQLEDVAISIPRAADLAGKVMIADREMRTLRNITGEQMGAYFGYSLATIDLNGDGLDDLAIGAPLYYNQSNSHKEMGHFERGRVYLAMQNSKHEFHIQTRLDGLKNRARFGISLANCGDLNRDGIADLAVGAPYDGPNGHGAVYIFMGRKNWPSESVEADQVIYAESIRNEGNLLKSFGWSLSGGSDMDSNQYPDLLVGDYQADRAILLRTRPVVNVTSTLTFQPEHFNLDDKNCQLPNNGGSVSCITMQYCIKYSGLQVDNRLAFITDIKLDTENKGVPRLFFLNSENKHEDSVQTTLSKDASAYCKPYKIYITRQIRDKLTPLRVDVEHNLVEGPDLHDFSSGITKLKPVLNKVAPNKVSKLSTIQKNCGQDNVCIPDLRLNMTSTVDQYTIGSNEKIILNVTVRNFGEDAFESMFYLTMPMAISFNSIDKAPSDHYPICYGAKPDQTGVNVLTCDLGNPQSQNDVVKFAVITESARGPFNAADFTFAGVVNSTNPERDERHREDNQVAIGIPIKVEVNLVLSGSSSPPKVAHNFTRLSRSLATGSTKFTSEAEIGPEVYHTYQLQNRGPSTINDIALTILWPTMTNDGDYLLYLVDEPQVSSNKIICKPSPDNVINPMNLKYMRGSPVSPTSAALSTSAAAVAAESPTIRYKRLAVGGNEQQLATSSSPVTTTKVDNSILQQNLCGPTKCNLFECNVVDLGNEIVYIKIRSRLYEETLSKLSWKEYGISSKLVAQVKSLPNNVSSHTIPPYVYKVETQIHTTGLIGPDLPPLWLILLAILIGIALFILVVCLFKYLGFFARKRPPKGVEREPLTPTIWNDYQYTPGDTAL